MDLIQLLTESKRALLKAILEMSKLSFVDVVKDTFSVPKEFDKNVRVNKEAKAQVSQDSGPLRIRMF